MSTEAQREAGRVNNRRYREKMKAEGRKRNPPSPEVQERKNAAAREARKGRYRASRLRHTYRMEPEDYETMLADQGGVCAICQRPPTKEHLHVDHDGTCCNARKGKTCGECVRGLLCRSCNTALNLLDDPMKRERAMAYLGLSV